VSLYSHVLEHVLQPCFDFVSRRHHSHYRRLLEQSQWWSRDELLAFQQKELHALLRHAFASVPYYQKVCAGAGVRLEDIRTLDDFARLPILTRADVNANQAELCSRAYKGELVPHATGGSSGMPVRFYMGWDSYDWRTAAARRTYSWSGCRFGEPSAYLWGAPVGRQSTWARLKNGISERLKNWRIFPTFSHTPDTWRQIYRSLVRYRPKFIVGYVSSLEAFVGFLRERNLALDGVRAVIATAESLTEPSRERIIKAIGAPVFNTYGSREFMSIAGECEQHDGLHINCENLLVETCRSADGDPSQILITDLHNYAMPFIRYAIDDAGVMEERPCACRRGLPRLAVVEGRVVDVLRTAGGRVVSSLFWAHVFKDIPEIVEYQVVQKKPDLLEIAAVLSAPLSESSRALLNSEFKKVLGNMLQIHIRQVDQIPRLPSGKRRVVVGLD
jgi:phenylacetate-CoA ligase